MEWASVITFVDPSLLIVVVACWIIGYVVKQTPQIPDWSIVYIVTLIAIVIVVAMQGFDVDAVLQGVLCGAVAVYGNQIIKQVKKAGDDK